MTAEGGVISTGCAIAHTVSSINSDINKSLAFIRFKLACKFSNYYDYTVFFSPKKRKN